MRFFADRAVTHRARFESLDNLVNAFHFVDIHAARRVKDEIEHCAQCVRLFVGIDKRGVFLKSLVIAVSRGLLQGYDCFGVVKVRFCGFSAAEFVLSYAVEVVVHGQSRRVEPL